MNKTMKPILFNTEMVKAILDGRKTQTRRPIKPQPPNTHDIGMVNAAYCGRPGLWLCDGNVQKCRNVIGVTEWKPQYQVGDVLYVRETWERLSCSSCEECFRSPDEKEGCFVYKATQTIYGDAHWHSPVTMPKWAARLFLEVTGVRAERLRDIRVKDVWAEGFSSVHNSGEKSIEQVWDSIYKNKRCVDEDGNVYCVDLGWSTNPYVWVFEFKRIM